MRYLVSTTFALEDSRPNYGDHVFLMMHIETSTMARITCMDALSAIKWFLLKAGLFPVDNCKSFTFFKLLCNFIFYSIIFSILLIDLINSIRTRNSAIFNMISCTIIPVANLGAKLLAIWWNKKSFFSLMKYLESPEFNAHNEVQNRYIQVVHHFAKVLLKILIAIVAGYVVVTGVSPFITDTAMMIPPPNDMGKYNLFYKIIHIFMQFYLGSTSICHDLLFMTLFGLCIAQLNILQHKLLNVYEEALELSVEVGLSSRFTEKQLLKDCVILHETIHQ